MTQVERRERARRISRLRERAECQLRISRETQDLTTELVRIRQAYLYLSEASALAGELLEQGAE